MKVLKNLFGNGSKIHADEIIMGNSNNSSLLSDVILEVESGGWTPELTTTNGDGVADYGSYNKFGSYYRIGKLVYITFRMNVESFANCTGYYVVSGLPFTSNSDADRYRYILTPNTLEGTADYSSIVQDQIRMRATPQSIASAKPFTSTKYIQGSGVYFIG